MSRTLIYPTERDGEIKNVFYMKIDLLSRQELV
jgi:hypothetical protein